MTSSVSSQKEFSHVILHEGDTLWVPYGYMIFGASLPNTKPREFQGDSVQLGTTTLTCPFMDGNLLGRCESRAAIVKWNKTWAEENLQAAISPWPEIAHSFFTWLTSLETSWAPPTEPTMPEDTLPAEQAEIPAITDGQSN